MKKFIAILVISLAALAFSQEKQGITANVELVSGTKQRAQFLGIDKDTVQLGGYIKNQFTVVRIPKEKFKSILDEQGNDLLATATKDSVAAAPDSSVATTDSSATIADSASAASADSTAAEENIPNIQLASPNVLVAFESNSGDPSLPTQMTALVARLLFESGEQVHVFRRDDFSECNDDICIQNTLAKVGAKTIYSGKISNSASADSISLELSRIIFEENLPEVHAAKMNMSRSTALSDAIKDNRMQKLLLETKGVVENTAKTIGYILVDTDPEGAMVSRSEKDAICKSPCAFAVTDTGRIEVNAYWDVDAQLWGAHTAVRPIPGDTAKVALRLKPISPEIQIISSPADAEIFPGKDPITKHSKSIGTTPNKFFLNEPGLANITLRRIGYKDTVVSFYVAPVSEIHLNVEMEKLTDYDEIAKQQDWQHERKMTRIGHALMASAIAPIIVSTIFVYLGNKDYDDAKDIKNDLEKPGSVNGANYKKMVSENKDLVDKGDKKMAIAASLAGAGVLLFGVGLFFTF